MFNFQISLNFVVVHLLFSVFVHLCTIYIPVTYPVLDHIPALVETAVLTSSSSTGVFVVVDDDGGGDDRHDEYEYEQLEQQQPL
jgi:hypothetical protein